MTDSQTDGQSDKHTDRQNKSVATSELIIEKLESVISTKEKGKKIYLSHRIIDSFPRIVK